MKKIIKRRLYNTDTATLMGSWNNDMCGSMEYCEESLYRKHTGEYFLYGRGGPMSVYAVCHGDSCVGSGSIMPFTEEEARDWAELRLSADDYIRIFGEVEE